MSTGARQETARLTDHIYGEAYLFDFFQLVHLLELWKPGKASIGRRGPYRDERLRLRPDFQLTFSPADVREVELLEGEPTRHRMTVNFMGIYGVSAPTPVYFSELIGFTDTDAEPITDFLDLFNHRLISLYYRAWVKHRFPYRYEPGAKDEISTYVLSFIGLGDEAVSCLAQLPVWRLMKYLGILAPQTRPPVSLSLMLSDYFGGIPVDVEELVPRWVKVPEEQRNSLGAANSSLGGNLTVGERVLDRAGKFRVVIGPLTYKQYLDMLPGTRKFHDLSALVRLWIFERLDYDFELRIHRHEVPPTQLSSDSPPQLGWTSWVLSSEEGTDTDPHIVFQRQDHAA